MTNKLVIPAILTATVLLAGMFAFMPVEKASTVHTTILSAATSVECETTTRADASDTSDITITADDDFQLTSVLIEFDGGDDNEDTDFPGITIIAGQGGEANTVALGDLAHDPAAGDVVFDLLHETDDITLLGSSLVGLTGNSFTITFEMTAGTEDDDESLTVTACGLLNDDDADSLAVAIAA